MKGRALTVSSSLAILLGFVVATALQRVELAGPEATTYVEASPEQLDPADVRETADSESSIADPEAVAEPAAPLRTLEETLAEFWGEEWETTRSLFSEADLEKPYEVRPWQQVSEEIEQQIVIAGEQAQKIEDHLTGWPSDSELERDWIRSNYGVSDLSEHEWVLVQESIDETNAKVTTLAQRYVSLLDDLLYENWEAGHYQHAPATLNGTTSPYEGDLLFNKNIAGEGWVVSIGVEKEATPEFAEIQREIRQLRHQRHMNLVQALNLPTGDTTR